MTTAALPRAGERSSGVYLAGLVWTFVRTDFKARYHGTLQGFVWALLKPLTMFLVLVGIFSFVFNSENDYRMSLIIGLFLWDFFAQGTLVGLTSLQTKGYLMSKAKFPSWIIVVSSVSNPLITLAVFWCVILLSLIVTGQTPTLVGVFLFVWYLLQFVAIVIGFSLGSSVLFLRYRDLNQVWEVLLQAGFFVAPIIYPLGVLPERFHKFLYLWPPTPVIQFARSVLISHTVPTFRAHLFLLIESVLLLCLGALVFRRYAPRAAEYV